MKYFDKPILESMLQDDLYKINMGSVAFHLFPRAMVTYEFFNRGKTQFPVGFGEALERQVQLMSDLHLTLPEANWMNTIPYIRPTYVEWFRGFRMDPSEVQIRQEGGDLRIKIYAPWYRGIYWEVKLMSVISELYFIMTGQEIDAEWYLRMRDKAKKLSNAGCHWIDFGTRRRFSGKIQNALVDVMGEYKGFLGTSNPFLAMKYGVTPHGTYAHESIMAMSALYGVRMANKMWMKHWSDHYEGNVGVSLTDTFTTKAFLKDFGSYEARLFDGVRHDSGDPYVWGDNMLRHYDLLGIPTSNKRLVFSDALTTDKYIALDQYFRKHAQPVGGIGTNFTNDVGVQPLNMVIKMTSANFGYGLVDVIKLSDDISKATGNPEAIRRAKESLNIM
jgi:nicotinate phosphoribosyltransferase